jgi:nucleoside-diphosphate-sugar epimerase
MNRKVLITGATGWLGQEYLYREFLKRGDGFLNDFILDTYTYEKFQADGTELRQFEGRESSLRRKSDSCTEFTC